MTSRWNIRKDTQSKPTFTLNDSKSGNKTKAIDIDDDSDEDFERY